jgi:predicted AAA+ superfamily ATPase
MKQETWLEENCILSYYRDKDKDEVDLVVENELGEIVGIEVKTSATVGNQRFRTSKLVKWSTKNCQELRSRRLSQRCKLR